MRQEYTWISTMEEGYSECGNSVPDTLILSSNASDDQLANKEVFLMIFLSVGVGIGLLAVTVERI